MFTERILSSLIDPKEDLAKLKTLADVDDAFLYERNGSQATYYIVLPAKVLMTTTKKVTGEVQNLLGGRLRSTGVTQAVINDTTRSVIEARVSLMHVISGSSFLTRLYASLLN